MYKRMVKHGATEIVPQAVAVTPAAYQPAYQPMTWANALDLWMRKLQSDATRATYSSHVKEFFHTVGAPDLGGVTMETLDAYAGVLRLRAERNTPLDKRLAPATVNIKLAAMRSFLKFCRRRGWTPGLTNEAIADALESLRGETQRPYQIVEGDETRRMLLAASQERYDPTRAVALLALGLGAGLRVAELCALDVGDLASDATGVYVDVREGKGRKDRQVPISQDVYELVNAYLADSGRAVHRTADRATPLFISRKHRKTAGRLTTRQARRVVIACAQRAGILDMKRITPHALRHSYAIDLLQGDEITGRPGAPLPAVAELLGHSSVAVTGKYLKHFERRDLGKYAPTLRKAGSET